MVSFTNTNTNNNTNTNTNAVSINRLSLVNFFRPKKREDFYIFPLGVRLLLTY